MPPVKNTQTMPRQSLDPPQLPRKGLCKSVSQNVQHQNANPVIERSKRKAENSPMKNVKHKRSALGNLTNTASNFPGDFNNKHPKNRITLTRAQYKSEVNDGSEQNTAHLNFKPPKVVPNQIQCSEEPNVSTISTVTNSKSDSFSKKKVEQDFLAKPQARRISSDFSSTQDSLYISALDDFSTTSDSSRYSDTFEAKDLSVISNNNTLKSDEKKKTIKAIKEIKDEENRILTPSPLKYVPPPVPDGIVDFDKLNWNDPFQVSHYAMDIFKYLKSREAMFQIEDYMAGQPHITKWMRTLLVDWMVEVQETFELNHETLYLAVKLVDLFLSKVVLHKDKLQLLGAATLFIACKFDERTPPLIEDFLYVCDGAYNQNELIQMEMTTLKTIDYDLGIPLSYRFLRRYARCAKVAMPTLTLARYILELSLMDYATIQFSDSQSASAALYIALRMHGEKNPWTKALEYYSGYKLEEFTNIVRALNVGLQRKPKGAVKTIRSKYSHVIFHEAAKVPVLSTEDLLADNI